MQGGLDTKLPDGQITCRNEAKRRSHGIDGASAAIELVDDRSADDADLDVLSLVADNSWNGGIVLSEFATKWPDLEGVLGRVTKDLVAIGEGHGRDILGHPFNSVAWLASQLASRGVTLKAGQVVMTRSVLKTVFPEQDTSYRFDLEEIGFVVVQVRMAQKRQRCERKRTR